MTACNRDPETTPPLQQVQDELWALAELQEIYRADHGRYADHIDSIPKPSAPNPEVSLLIVSGGARGWSGSAGHQLLGSGNGCAIYVGEPAEIAQTPIIPIEPGRIVCTDPVRNP